MPPTRKVSGGRQATLSFNHRVTKPSVQRQSAKEAALLTDKAKEVDKEKEANEENQTQEEEVEDKKAKVGVEAEEEAAPAEEDEEEEEEPIEVTAPVVVARHEAEIEADGVSDAQVRRYWRAIEAQGIARRVHQEGLDLGEKVLRHFDVSSQFGVSFYDSCSLYGRLAPWESDH